MTSHTPVCHHPPMTHPHPHSIHLGPTRATSRLLIGPDRLQTVLKGQNLVPLGPDTVLLGLFRGPSLVPKPASFYLITLVLIPLNPPRAR